MAGAQEATGQLSRECDSCLGEAVLEQGRKDRVALDMGTGGLPNRRSSVSNGTGRGKIGMQPRARWGEGKMGNDAREVGRVRS